MAGDSIELAEYCFTIRFIPVKGAYINPNTVAVSEPVELSPKHVRRIDMVSDVSGAEFIRLIELYPKEAM